MSENQRLVAGRYALGSVIGTGGVATVYSAHDNTLNRTVAVKVVNDELAANAAFDAALIGEAKAVSSLTHPNIVAVLDAGEDSYLDETGTAHQRAFIVMEKVEGLELSRLTARGALKVSEAVRVTTELLSALNYAHNSGIIHRDVKPGNIMITREGQVKVLDFGIARAVADTFDDLEQTTAILGTAAYFSPEQARGEQVDTRTDVYAAGVVLYEMLTGRPPFAGDTAVAVAHQHLHAQPTPPSHLNNKVPTEIDAVVLHALNKNRDGRYATAAEFATELSRAEAGEAPQFKRPNPIDPTTGLIISGLAAAEVDAAATQAFVAESVEAVSVGDYTPDAPVADDVSGVNKPNQTSPLSRLYTPLRPSDAPVEVPSAPAASAESDELDEDLPPEFAAVFGAGVSARSEEARNAPKPVKRRRALNAVALISSIFVIVAILGVLISMTKGNEIFGSSRVIPSVDNLTYNQAVSLLSRQGLLAQEAEETSDEIGEGKVIRTEPPSGVKVENGATVRVYVSTGKTKQGVPPVTGMTVASATSAIQNAGFEVGTITKTNSATIKADMVISTDPAQGTQLAQGDKVNLVVSNGQFEMPDLKNKTIKDASAELSKLLISPTITADPSCTKAAEPTVNSQSVKPGLTKQGTAVTLTYCTGS